MGGGRGKSSNRNTSGGNTSGGNTSTSDGPKLAAHLRTDPRSALPRTENQHLVPKMEAMFANNHERRQAALAAQGPPKTASSVGAGFVDFLDADFKAFEDQQLALFSFLSPEKAVQRYEEFVYQEFVQWNDLSTNYKVCADFADFMAAKHGLEMDSVRADFEDFMKTEAPRLKDVDITTKLTMFNKKNGADLRKKYEQREDEMLAERGVDLEKYRAENGRESTVRGLIMWGAVRDQSDARALLEEIKGQYGNDHPDILVGAVGQWMPWDPAGLIRSEYLEPELNELMAGYEAKQARKKSAFEKRKAEFTQKADADNQATAAKYGGKTTMELDAEGRPVNTTVEEHLRRENLMRGLDGNGIDAMLKDGESLGQFFARRRQEEGGAVAAGRAVDAITGEEPQDECGARAAEEELAAPPQQQQDGDEDGGEDD